jgi:hypothetical protein
LRQLEKAADPTIKTNNKSKPALAVTENDAGCAIKFIIFWGCFPSQLGEFVQTGYETNLGKGVDGSLARVARA